VLLILVVAADFYGIHYLRHKIIRANSWAGFAAVLAKGDEQKRLVTAIGVSEVTLFIWSWASWLAAGLLALSALWSAVRRRFAWRLLSTGAIATILAAVLTVAGRTVLEKYAHFEPMSKGMLAAVFLAHSLPGWLILIAWRIRRRSLRSTQAEPTAPATSQPPAPPAA
jgi:FlaA1/EpsC-like NDP-sugar epimerase